MKEKMSRRSFSKKTVSALTVASLLGPKAFSQTQKKSFEENENDYDYIVVGSGAGGGPLACNLARHGFKVLVLEAGKQDESNHINEVPAFHAQCSEDPNFSWHYFVKHYSSLSENMKDSKYVPGKGIFYPRGATVGGSTINNAMITVLPHESDFDYIASITGDVSWSAANMRKYREILDKSFYLNYYDPETNGHKRDAWLPVQYPDLLGAGFDDPLLIKILLANIVHNRMGIIDFLIKKHLFNPNIQYFAEGGTGAVLVPQNTNLKTKKRHAVREYLLETARDFPNNLVIQTNALASKIIMDGKKAVGVEYLGGENLYSADPHYNNEQGVKKEVYANKEVILSAGAFNSPQLLKLSGIGPRKELEGKGISVIHDLPGVGKNLQDRYEVGVSFKFKRNVLNGVNLNTNDEAFKEFYNKRRGPYTSNGALAGSIIKSDSSLEDADIFNFALLGAFKGYEPGYSEKIREDKSIVTWAILKGHTDNTGEVTLKTKDPRDTPDINFKYFGDGTDTESRDMKAMIHGVKNIRSLMKNPFVKFHHRGEVWPGSHLNTDEEIKNFVKNESWGHHASCTNKIGGDNDEFAVLDSKFRVRGVENLRVVDASVFPKIPGFFIAVPIYMISEKATDDILDTAGVRRNDKLLRRFLKNREDGIKEDLLRKEELSVVCYPNPFKEKLVFDFGKVIKSGQEVNIWLWDKKGTLVRRQTQNYSLTNIIMNVSDLPSGIYIYIIQTDGFEKRGKLIKE